MKIEDIYNDLPTLETERLILRKITLNDVQDVFNYASEPDVSRFVPWEAHQSIEDSYNFINYILKQYEEGKLAPWAIELKQNKKVIGTIDFVAWFPHHFRAEIGFILSKEYWGMGLMVEAAAKVIQFGFEKMELNKIEASCMVENVQSQGVLQKLGMRLEGISRQKYFIKGKFRDMANYSILKSEYEIKSH
jgi:[ribosomal protein S5]-alanine N-acetyltransferase